MSEDSTSYNRPKDVDFGLPDIHLKPLSKKKESFDSEPTVPTSQVVSRSSKGNGSRNLVIGLILVLVVIAAGGYYAYEEGYIFQPKQASNDATTPSAISTDNNASEETTLNDNEGWGSEGFVQSDTVTILEGDSLESSEAFEPLGSATQEAMKLQEFEKPTGEYHMIIASVVTLEAAREDGNKLLADDVSIAILYPRAGRNENFRLSAASFATLDEAKNQLNFYRQKFGESVWVLRY